MEDETSTNVPEQGGSSHPEHQVMTRHSKNGPGEGRPSVSKRELIHAAQGWCWLSDGCSESELWHLWPESWDLFVSFTL